MHAMQAAASPKSGLFGDGPSSVWLHRGERRFFMREVLCHVQQQTSLKVEGSCKPHAN